MIKQFVLLSSILLVCKSSKFPSNIPQCIHGDNICIKNAINEIVGLAQNGIPELNLIPLDPLHVDFINIIQGENENSPVNLALKLINIDVLGMGQLKTNKILGFNGPAGSKGEIHSIIPRLTIHGDYKMKGKILVLPIQGHGKCNFTIDNAKASIKFTTKLVEKKGREYLRIDRLAVSINPSRAYINLENLFNGDKALGQSMNIFLNENWKTIFVEMKPVIDDAIGEIVKNIMNNVFAKYPYQEMFLQN